MPWVINLGTVNQRTDRICKWDQCITVGDLPGMMEDRIAARRLDSFVCLLPPCSLSFLPPFPSSLHHLPFSSLPPFLLLFLLSFLYINDLFCAVRVILKETMSFTSNNLLGGRNTRRHHTPLEYNILSVIIKVYKNVLKFEEGRP